MITKQPFIAIPVFFLSLLILHVLAIQFYLYWTAPWFDILMHFLAGFFVAYAVTWFAHTENMSHKKLCTIAIVSALFAGILWEVYEYTTGMTFTLYNYKLDTFIDLAMDVAGGLALYSYILSRQHKEI